MKQKQEKLPTLSESHREALARLGSNKDFQSLIKLMGIEENNIILQAFKINSSDPELNRKKAWHEGRIWEIRKIVKTFEEVKKGQDES